MSFTGTIENGVVKLPSGLGLPDGTQVRVEPITKPAPRNELTRRLANIAGKVSNLPSDFAAEHDHYLHGTPSARNEGRLCGHLFLPRRRQSR